MDFTVKSERAIKSMRNLMWKEDYYLNCFLLSEDACILCKPNAVVFQKAPFHDRFLLVLTFVISF